jgi:hypothetical protein
MENKPTKKEKPSISNVLENKELEHYFKDIFEDRLKKIKKITEQEARDKAHGYNDSEIQKIHVDVPVIFFDPNNLEIKKGEETNFAKATDIWIEDPEELDMNSQYIHSQLADKLAKFLNKDVTKMPYFLPGYLIVNEKGERYLILEETRVIKLNMNLENDTEVGISILDSLNKYNIKRVLEKIGGSRDAIPKSTLDRRRETLHFINLAKKYGMNNTQYLRLVTLAKSLFAAGQQTDLDKLAQSIVKDENGTKIDTEHLPIPKQRRIRK